MTMQTVTQVIIDHGLSDRCIRASQLKHLIDGSHERRYGLVNRAIKSGELLRIQRGLYILADSYRSHPCHPFVLAQALAPGSYVSFETALAYHDWIPERVHITASTGTGRKSRQYKNPILGSFSFHPLAIQPGYFLTMVSRVSVDSQTALVAQPFRALIDLICLRKIEWQGVEWLTDGLRIEPELINRISKDDIKKLQQTYRHKRVKSFLSSLSMEIPID